MLLELCSRQLLLSLAYAQISAVPEPGDPTAQDIKYNTNRVYSVNVSHEELALLDWSSGVRVAYCSESPAEMLAESFKAAVTMTLNRYCKNATACRLLKPVQFTPEHVVLLDGYPKRDYAAVQFRFVVVLPHEAVPKDRLRQPLLSREILSGFLRSSIKEFEWKFGWKVLSYERFPKFDSVTEFMNTALIPIGFLLLAVMFFLAYWSSTISRSTGGGEGWFVSGSSGGKNTALKRTLEIIEEQKVLDAELARQEAEKNTSSSDDCVAPSTVSGSKLLRERQERSNMVVDPVGQERISAPPSSLTVEQSESSLLDKLPDVVVASSKGAASVISSLSSTYRQIGTRRTSRRLSSIDEGIPFAKRHRKKRMGVSSKKHEHRHWKSTSMALSGFSGR